MLLDIFFTLSDADANISRREKAASTHLFIVSIFMIPLFYCGIFFNWLHLTPEELQKKFELFSIVDFTLAAYALSCLQTTTIFRFRMIYNSWSNATRMITCFAPLHLTYLKKVEVDFIMTTSNLITSKDEDIEKEHIEKRSKVITEVVKSNLLGSQIDTSWQNSLFSASMHATFWRVNISSPVMTSYTGKPHSSKPIVYDPSSVHRFWLEQRLLCRFLCIINLRCTRFTCFVDDDSGECDCKEPESLQYTGIICDLPPAFCTIYLLITTLPRNSGLP